MRGRAAIACVLCALAACTFGDLGDLDRGSADAGPGPDQPPAPAPGAGAQANVEDAAADDDDDDGGGAEASAIVDAGADARPACDPSATLIAGNETEPTAQATDDTGEGYMDAYGFLAASPATATCAFVYLDLPLADDPLFYVAVYSETNDAGEPDSLLATATFTSMTHGWNGAPLDHPLSIAAGEHVWLGIGAPTSSVHYRYRDGMCPGRLDHGDKTAANGPANPFNAYATFPSTCDALIYLTP